MTQLYPNEFKIPVNPIALPTFSLIMLKDKQLMKRQNVGRTIGWLKWTSEKHYLPQCDIQYKRVKLNFGGKGRE